MTAAEMGELLGLKKTERYWLLHRHHFEWEEILGVLDYVVYELIKKNDLDTVRKIWIHSSVRIKKEKM